MKKLHAVVGIALSLSTVSAFASQVSVNDFVGSYQVDTSDAGCTALLGDLSKTNRLTLSVVQENGETASSLILKSAKANATPLVVIEDVSAGPQLDEVRSTFWDCSKFKAWNTVVSGDTITETLTTGSGFCVANLPPANAQTVTLTLSLQSDTEASLSNGTDSCTLSKL